MPWGIAKIAAYDFWAMHQSPVQRVLRVTSDKDQKMPELEKIDFLRTQPSEAY